MNDDLGLRYKVRRFALEHPWLWHLTYAAVIAVGWFIVFSGMGTLGFAIVVSVMLGASLSFSMWRATRRDLRKRRALLSPQPDQINTR